MMLDRRLKYRFRVVSDRPMPARSDGKGPANSKYNLHSMEVDDFFFVAGDEVPKARAAVYVYAKRHGKTFTTRSAGEGKIIVMRTK